jgi:hypothetical protein
VKPTRYAVFLSDGSVIGTTATPTELVEHIWTFIETVKANTGLEVKYLVPIGEKEEVLN